MHSPTIHTTQEFKNYNRSRGVVKSQNMLQLEIKVPQIEYNEYQLSPLEQTRIQRFKNKLLSLHNYSK